MSKMVSVTSMGSMGTWIGPQVTGAEILGKGTCESCSLQVLFPLISLTCKRSATYEPLWNFLYIHCDAHDGL
jgi:hypothetical protein